MKKEATSAVNLVRFVDICKVASSDSPLAFAIAPNVDTYFLACNSVKPKFFNALSANSFIILLDFPNVVSTTFCTSAKLDDNSKHFLLTATKAAKLKPLASVLFKTLNLLFILFTAPPTTLTTFLMLSAILVITLIVVCATLAVVLKKFSPLLVTKLNPDVIKPKGTATLPIEEVIPDKAPFPPKLVNLLNNCEKAFTLEIEPEPCCCEPKFEICSLTLLNDSVFACTDTVIGFCDALCI